MELTRYDRDRRPSARFPGRPLSPLQEDAFSGDMAEQVWAGTGEVGMELNRDVTTRLPLDEAIAGLPAGIYALQAAIPGADPYDRPAATQWCVLSDLGLAMMAGTDGLHVFVRSLASAAPKAGVTVSLMSRANRVLGTEQTDAAGHAQFPAGLMRGQAGAVEGLPLTAILTRPDGVEHARALSPGGVAGGHVLPLASPQPPRAAPGRWPFMPSPTRRRRPRTSCRSRISCPSGSTST
ncbi:hypothetical protein [Rhodovulum sp.]|uniref:hypothetical protein n=1 Tax=Rhodovulum sp. TaxID=34009 RepID=UPI0017998E27|nr:hypothetical protein [Rhodovulum sp.]HDR28449.1 hypothetical protein [Rhodovulum sp.]